jgi:hypothetical protein
MWWPSQPDTPAMQTEYADGRTHRYTSRFREYKLTHPPMNPRGKAMNRIVMAWAMQLWRYAMMRA